MTHYLVWARAAAALLGLTYLVLGIWAFAAPDSFYDSIAPFPPGNAHFLRDAGAFQIGIGLVALACAAAPAGNRPVMAAVAATTGLHVAAHVIDIEAGGSPAFDIASLSLMTAVAAAAALGMPGHRPADRGASDRVVGDRR